MQQPIEFYNKEINQLNTKFNTVKKQLLRTRMLRLLAFITIVLDIKIFFLEN